MQSGSKRYSPHYVPHICLSCILKNENKIYNLHFVRKACAKFPRNVNKYLDNVTNTSMLSHWKSRSAWLFPAQGCLLEFCGPPEFYRRPWLFLTTSRSRLGKYSALQVQLIHCESVLPARKWTYSMVAFYCIYF